MSAARTKGYIILLEGMREIERILRERMHEDEETIKECGVPLLVESMADQIDELKAQLETTLPEAHAEVGGSTFIDRMVQSGKCVEPMCGEPVEHYCPRHAGNWNKGPSLHEHPRPASSDGALLAEARKEGKPSVKGELCPRCDGKGHLYFVLTGETWECTLCHGQGVYVTGPADPTRNAVRMTPRASAGTEGPGLRDAAVWVQHLLHGQSKDGGGHILDDEWKAAIADLDAALSTSPAPASQGEYEDNYLEATRRLIGSIHVVKLLKAASHVLRSYEFGNSDPSSAKHMADQIDVAFQSPEPPQGEEGK